MKNNTTFTAGIYGSNGYSFFDKNRKSKTYGNVISAKTKDKLLSKIHELDNATITNPNQSSKHA